DMIGLERDRAFVSGGRVLKPAHRLEHNSQIVVKFRHLAVRLDGLADQISGLDEAACPIGLDARVMQAGGVGSRRGASCLTPLLALLLSLGAALLAVHEIRIRRSVMVGAHPGNSACRPRCNAPQSRCAWER